MIRPFDDPPDEMWTQDLRCAASCSAFPGAADTCHFKALRLDWETEISASPYPAGLSSTCSPDRARRAPDSESEAEPPPMPWRSAGNNHYGRPTDEDL